MCKFESKVLDGLLQCGVNLNNPQLRIGVAVSGGADSVSLLVSLSNQLKKYGLSLFVISVNHNIRSEEESGGDALYVKKLCEKLNNKNKNVICEIVELEKGKVNSVSNVRCQGIEDAARFLRYEVFESFIQKNKLDYLCLAHNQNDQLETLVMRFLQGSGCESGGGITNIRGKYIRPMLDIQRYEIEDYLKKEEISWRTDSTNFDTNYLRNKIRHKLIPLLNEEFEGWQKAVIAGGKKSIAQNKIIDSLIDEVEYEVAENGIVVSIECFLELSKGLRTRLLMKFINLLGVEKRVPYVFLEDVCNSILNSKSSRFEKKFNNIEIEIKNNSVFIKKTEKSLTDLVFFDIIEENGKFMFPFGELDVFITESGEYANVSVNGKTSISQIPVPFCVRNIQLDDEVECSDGTYKKIADVISDWHVDEDYKSLIPVFQLIGEKNQPVKVILGSVFGYKDWIVK